jgi:hypothetical protein
MNDTPQKILGSSVIALMFLSNCGTDKLLATPIVPSQTDTSLPVLTSFQPAKGVTDVIAVGTSR